MQRPPNPYRAFFIFLQPAISSYGHFMFSGSRQGRRRGHLSLCAVVAYFCCKISVLVFSEHFEVALGCLDSAVGLGLLVSNWGTGEYSTL